MADLNSNRVGVIPVNALPGLKRHALLFDSLVVPNLSRFRVANTTDLVQSSSDVFVYERHHDPDLFADVEWLVQREIVRELPVEQFLWTWSGQASVEVIDHIAAVKRTDQEWKLAFRNGLSELDQLYKILLATEARACGSYLRGHEQRDAVAVLESGDHFGDAISGTSEEIAHVVLDHLPMPSDITPWEQILEFRSDPQTKRLLSALRRWMREKTQDGSSVREATEELRDLVGDFESHMQRNRIVTVSGTLEAILSAAVAATVTGITVNEVAGALAAVSTLGLRLRRQNATLMNEEAQAPGAELAYVAKARERFGR